MIPVGIVNADRKPIAGTTEFVGPAEAINRLEVRARGRGGVSGGEQVIVQGLQGVRPGAAVRATPLPQTLSRN